MCSVFPRVLGTFPFLLPRNPVTVPVRLQALPSSKLPRLQCFVLTECVPGSVWQRCLAVSVSGLGFLDRFCHCYSLGAPGARAGSSFSGPLSLRGGCVESEMG